MRFLALFILLPVAALFAQQQNKWPVIKHYEGKFIEKIAMPVGGIGTGNISIGGNCQWKDVEIMNKPALGFIVASVAMLALNSVAFTKSANVTINIIYSK